MHKTLTKVLSIVTLCDLDPISEQAYCKHKSYKALESPLTYILVILAQETFLLGIGLIYDDYTIILTQSVLLFLTLCSAIIRRKLGTHIESLLSTFFCITHILGIVSLHMRFEDLPKVAIYVQSYFLGIFQQLLMIWMFRFRTALVFNIFIIVLRCFVSSFLNFESKEEILVGAAAPIYVDLAFLVVMFNIENNERKMLKKIHTYSTASLKGSDYEQILFKYMPQSVLLVTEDIKRVLFTNDSFEKMTSNQSKSSNSFRKALETLFIKKNNFSLKEKFSSLFEEGQPCISLCTFLEKVFYKKIINPPEGPITVYASHSTSLVKSRKSLYEVTLFQAPMNGENVIAIIFNDITEQKSFISMKAADSSKDKLLATISHELKTPLHGVLGGLNMALQASKDPETLSSLHLCRKSAKLLASTVNSILDLQLFRRNRLTLRFSKMNLKSLIDEVESLFAAQCSEKGLIFRTKISEKVPKYIQTDKERLSQTLVNLVSNSIKFTKSGKITIRVDLDPVCEGNILFEVKDTGVGITPEDQLNISKMYGKDDEDEEEESVGTHGIGLGLTVSNYLAKLLNRNGKEGGIKCSSEPTKGSSFSFSISNGLRLPRKGSIEEDMASFLDEMDEFDIEARIGRYSQKRGVPSRNFGFSKLNISAGSHSNEQDDFYLLNICSRNRELSLPNPLGRDSTHHTLISPTLLKERKGERNISIKVTPPDSAILKVKTEVTSTGNLKGWVFIVDDNPFNLMVARKIIEDMGYSVKTANDGEEAIVKCKNQVKQESEFFKLVLMDCQMPIMDGYDCTRELRKLMVEGVIPTCPIVALTANDTEEDIKKCLKSGMNEVLSKPLKEDDIQKIQNYLRNE